MLQTFGEMRAAAEQTNDMWQTISESEQSSNGK